MNNAEWCMRQGIRFRDLTGYTLGLDPQLVSIGYYDKDCKYHECYHGKPFNALVTDCILTWLDMPHAEPILTDKERKYIEDVCRPFRYKVKRISKTVVNHLDEPADYYLVIRFFNECFAMFFPSFDGSAMYRGMEDNKWYTLQELGLYEDND